MIDSQSDSKTRASRKPGRSSRAKSTKATAKTVAKSRSSLRAAITPTKRNKSPATSLAERPEQGGEQFSEDTALTYQPESMRVALISREVMIGPLPPPDMLAAYERIRKGTMDRLLIRMEQEQSHRQKIEERESQGKEKRKHRGQQHGLVIAIAALACASFCIYSGFGWAASVISVAGIGGSLTPALLRQGRLSVKKSRKKKTR